MGFDVAHIIGPDTPADILDQLAAVAMPYDKIISLGNAPRHDSLTGVRSIRLPINMPVVAGAKLAQHVLYNSILHVWSPELIEAALVTAGIKKNRMLFSATGIAAKRQQNALPWIAGRTGCNVTVPTQAGYEFCMQIGADPSKFSILPPAVTIPENLDQLRTQTREKLQLAGDTLVFALPEEMSINSGHKIAIWAFSILRWAIPNAKLLLPGNGSQLSSLQHFAREAGFPEDIIFSGRKLSMPEVIAASDITLALSQQLGNLSRIALASACSKPIIATARAEINEICPHNNSAILCKHDPQEVSAAMLKLADSSELRKSLGETGRKFCSEKFTQQSIRQNLEKIYATLKPITI